MELSDKNRNYLKLLRDIYDISAACDTRTYIWGGFVPDIVSGRFIREHGDLDGFIRDMLAVLDRLIALYQERGYETAYLKDVHMLQIYSGDVHASFNRLDIDENIAMWRHIGEQGTVYFPAEWLDTMPRLFYGARVYTSGICFEYAIKAHPHLLSPKWKLRKKDCEALRFCDREIRKTGIQPEDICGQVWSRSPYWAQMGYKEYNKIITAEIPEQYPSS